MARRTLTDKSIQALKPAAKRYTVPDPKLAGHYVRVMQTGAKSFVAVARDTRGKQIWHTIGSTNLYRLEEARELARTAIKAIRAGEERAEPQSFQAVAEEWMKRHVRAKGLRSESGIHRILDKQILPAWGGRDFASIRRGDVTKLLDTIEDNHGPVAADSALAHLSRIFNWYTTRHEDYASPIVKGMRRTNPKARARKRILSDDELREVWRVAETNGTFGAFIRVALLTAQRREKVLAMRREDIQDAEWIIPTGKNEKRTAGSLLLSDAVLAIIDAQPRFESNPYVFAGRGHAYMQGASKRKAQFDAKLTSVAPWAIHDLRRTSRSLMSRAGIRPDIAERVLGYAIKSVEGIYDRHSYREEKAHALRALAGLIESILHPSDRVVSLRG